MGNIFDNIAAKETIENARYYYKKGISQDVVIEGISERLGITLAEAKEIFKKEVDLDYMNNKEIFDAIYENGAKNPMSEDEISEFVSTVRAERIQTHIDNYVKRVSLDKELDPLRFDLRAYYKYIEENNISGEDIPQEILDRFII